MLEWTAHPVKRKPLVSVAVTLFVCLVVVAVFYATESRGFAVLAAVVLLLSLARFYFPTSYRLTEEKVMIKYTSQSVARPWSQFRSCYPDKNGILLSPFLEPSRLENFRGLYLMFANNADEVTAFVKSHIGREETAVEKSPNEEDAQ